MVRLLVCGAVNWDVTCFVEQLPMVGQDIPVKHILRVSGGTGGNVAVAAARILGPKEVALVAALGDDATAQQQLEILNAEGVITDGIQVLAGEESGQAYILVDQNGQNVIASCLGANARLESHHLSNPPVERSLSECQGIVLSDPPLDVATRLINLAKQRGIPVLWDPGILLSQKWEVIQPLVKQADVLFLNEAEVSILFGRMELDTVWQHLREWRFHNLVVLKLGARGAVMVEVATGVVVEVPALPLKALGLDVVNAVGCGDVFAGVFAAYYVMGSSLAKSLIMAGAAAGFNATRLETRGCPDRVSLEEMVQRSQGVGFAYRERKLSKS